MVPNYTLDVDLGKHNSDSLLGTFWVVSTLHLSYLSKSLIIVTLSISQYTYSIILHCSKKELYYCICYSCGIGEYTLCGLVYRHLRNFCDQCVCRKYTACVPEIVSSLLCKVQLLLTYQGVTLITTLSFP